MLGKKEELARKDAVADVVKGLSDFISMQEIAELVEVHWRTVYRWQEKKCKCSKGNLTLLQQELNCRLDNNNNYEQSQGNGE